MYHGPKIKKSIEKRERKRGISRATGSRGAEGAAAHPEHFLKKHPNPQTTSFGYGDQGQSSEDINQGSVDGVCAEDKNTPGTCPYDKLACMGPVSSPLTALP